MPPYQVEERRAEFDRISCALGEEAATVEELKRELERRLGDTLEIKTENDRLREVYAALRCLAVAHSGGHAAQPANSWRDWDGRPRPGEERAAHVCSARPLVDHARSDLGSKLSRLQAPSKGAPSCGCSGRRPARHLSTDLRGSDT